MHEFFIVAFFVSVFASILVSTDVIHIKNEFVSVAVSWALLIVSILCFVFMTAT